MQIKAFIATLFLASCISALPTPGSNSNMFQGLSDTLEQTANQITGSGNTATDNGNPSASALGNGSPTATLTGSGSGDGNGSGSGDGNGSGSGNTAGTDNGNPTDFGNGNGSGNSAGNDDGNGNSVFGEGNTFALGNIVEEGDKSCNQGDVQQDGLVNVNLDPCINIL